jgi:Na+-driven multidrug efflux pump
MTGEQVKNAISYTAFHLLILFVYCIVLVGLVVLCEVLDVHKFIENVFIPGIAWLFIAFFLFAVVRCIAFLIWYFVLNRKGRKKESVSKK